MFGTRKVKKAWFDNWGPLEGYGSTVDIQILKSRQDQLQLTGPNKHRGYHLDQMTHP